MQQVVHREDAVRLLVMAVAEDLVAVVREHDRERLCASHATEHILARYGIKGEDGKRFRVYLSIILR